MSESGMRIAEVKSQMKRAENELIEALDAVKEARYAVNDLIPAEVTALTETEAMIHRYVTGVRVVLKPAQLALEAAEDCLNHNARLFDSSTAS